MQHPNRKSAVQYNAMEETSNRKQPSKAFKIITAMTRTIKCSSSLLNDSKTTKKM